MHDRVESLTGLLQHLEKEGMVPGEDYDLTWNEEAGGWDLLYKPRKAVEYITLNIVKIEEDDEQS